MSHSCSKIQELNKDIICPFLRVYVLTRISGCEPQISLFREVTHLLNVQFLSPFHKQCLPPASWLSDSGTDGGEGLGTVRWHRGKQLDVPSFVLPWAVKEEPQDEEEETKMKAPLRAARKTPGLSKDVSVAELLRELSLTKDEELLFLQLPDTLPGQPPTQDIKPVKTEVQGEDGQMVVIKQEKDRVCSGVSSGEIAGWEHLEWKLTCRGSACVLPS